MKHFMKYAAMSLAALALVACEAPPEGATEKQIQYNRAETIILRHIGEGLCLNCFNSYRTMPTLKAYAVSTSGAFGYSNGQKTERAARDNALRMCRARNSNSNKPCKLLMVGDRYVWK